MAVVDGGECLMQRVIPSINSNVALPRKMPAQRDDYCLRMQTMHTYIHISFGIHGNTLQSFQCSARSCMYAYTAADLECFVTIF